MPQARRSNGLFTSSTNRVTITMTDVGELSFTRHHALGVGTPLVMLHGFLGSQRTWSKALARLPEDVCCVTVDLPGHGGSPRWDAAALSMEGIVSALLRTLDTARISQCRLALSMAANRAPLCAGDPQRCRALILESTNPGIEGPPNASNVSIWMDLRLGDRGGRIAGVLDSPGGPSLVCVPASASPSRSRRDPTTATGDRPRAGRRVPSSAEPGPATQPLDPTRPFSPSVCASPARWTHNTSPSVERMRRMFSNYLPSPARQASASAGTEERIVATGRRRVDLHIAPNAGHATQPNNPTHSRMSLPRSWRIRLKPACGLQPKRAPGRENMERDGPKYAREDEIRM